MNYLDLVKTQREFWHNAMTLVDTVLTIGIDNTFSRAEREMIFALCSEQNNCEFCAKHHKDFALDLGYDNTLTPDDGLMIKKVVNHTYKYVNYNVDKLNNIRYISSVCKMINHLIKEFDVNDMDDYKNMLKDIHVKNGGYTNRYNGKL